MGGNLTIMVRGEKDVIRALEKVAGHLSGKRLEDISADATKPMLDEVRRSARAVGDSGALANSIIVKHVQYQGGRLVYTIIGPDVEYTQMVTRTTIVPEGTTFQKQEKARPANYAHLVEFGTAAHALSRSQGAGQHPGARAKPFMRPAFDTMQATVIDRFGREIGKGAMNDSG